MGIAISGPQVCVVVDSQVTASQDWWWLVLQWSGACAGPSLPCAWWHGQLPWIGSPLLGTLRAGRASARSRISCRNVT